MPPRPLFEVLPCALVPLEHALVKLDPNLVAPQRHRSLGVGEQILRVEHERRLARLGLDKVEQQAQLAVACLVRVEMLEVRLAVGATEPVQARDGALGRANQERVRDLLVEQEVCWDEGWVGRVCCGIRCE